MRSSEFAGGGLPIGAQADFLDMGPSFTLADRSVWLRSGSLVAAVDAPRFAALKQYQVPGKRITNMPAYGANLGPVQVAGNGAGVFIAAGGAATLPAGSSQAKTGLWRSTDWGLTWTDISASMPYVFYATAVAYGGGRFVVTGFNTQAGQEHYLNLMYSADAGATWAAGASYTGSAGAKPQRITRLTYTGSRFVGIVGMGGGAAAFITLASVDGTAFAFNPSNYISLQNPVTDVLEISAHGGRAVATFTSGATNENFISWDSADGQTWATNTKPVALSVPYISAAVAGQLAFAHQSPYYPEVYKKPLTAGAWGSAMSAFPVTQFAGGGAQIIRLMASSVAADARLIAVDNRRTMHIFDAAMGKVEKARQLPPINGMAAAASGGRAFVFDATSANGAWCWDTNDMDSGDFCGISRYVAPSIGTGQVTYVRIA